MRHAIYYTPDPSSDFHVLGSRWLGRDAISGAECGPHADPRLEDITAEARRYGFHGTLKPPFQMKDGTSLATLEVATRRIAQQHTTFVAGHLTLQVVDGFLALAPNQAVAALDNLAADCVRHLDDFRVPASDAELARRRAVNLTERQDANLIRWGYPYVFDDFRFHVTLTRRLTDEERDWVVPLARRHFATVLDKPFVFDTLSIVTEPAPDAPLIVELRLPLIISKVKAA